MFHENIEACDNVIYSSCSPEDYSNYWQKILGVYRSSAPIHLVNDFLKKKEKHIEFWGSNICGFGKKGPVLNVLHLHLRLCLNLHIYQHQYYNHQCCQREWKSLCMWNCVLYTNIVNYSHVFSSGSELICSWLGHRFGLLLTFTIFWTTYTWWKL